MQDDSRPVSGYPVPAANGQHPPPVATAYAYQQNPNPYGYGPYYAPPPPRQNPRASLFRRLTVAILAVMIVFGAVMLILWLVLRPSLPDFTLHSFSQSNLTTSSQRLTGSWRASFNVSNPNKKLSLHYHQVLPALFYRDFFLTETRLEPFQQGTHDVRTVDASYSVLNAYVDSKVVDGINGDKSRGETKYNLKVVAEFWFKYGGWSGRRRYLRVWCSDVAANFSNGAMVGGAKKCRVD